MNKKDIRPRNGNNQPHGYWERYYNNGDLVLKCNYNNGDGDGYCEWGSYSKIFILV